MAVLAVFEDVEADRALYFLVQFHPTETIFRNLIQQVFGEALLNDGVTFVFYEGVKELAFVEDDNIEDISVPPLHFLSNMSKTFHRWSPISMSSSPSSLLHSGWLPGGPDGRPGDQVHQREGRVPQAHPQPALRLPRLQDHPRLRILQHPRTHRLRHCPDQIRSKQYEVSSVRLSNSPPIFLSRQRQGELPDDQHSEAVCNPL